jgi:hypothetical protein
MRAHKYTQYRNNNNVNALTTIVVFVFNGLGNKLNMVAAAMVDDGGI